MLKNKTFLITLIACFAVFQAKGTNYNFPDYLQLTDNQFKSYYSKNNLPYYLMNKQAKTAFSTKITFNYADKTAVLTPIIGGDTLYGNAVPVPLENYLKNMFVKEYKSNLYTVMHDALSETDRAENSGIFSEIEIKIPKDAMPKSLRKFMGKKAGRINIDGSQKITFSGTNNTRKTNQINLNQRKSFDFQMKQELNLILKGTIGEKIFINVTHHSSSEGVVGSPDKIQIEYKGDEDEIVQSVQGGDITLALSGSNFISYSASSEGLFGVKADFKIGDLSLTTIMSQEEGKKNTTHYNGNSQADSSTVSSKSFSQRVFYYAIDPYVLYDLETTDSPKGWKHNAIKTDDNGDWLLSPLGYLSKPRDGTLKVYLDDATDTDDIATGAVPGMVFSPNQTSNPGSYPSHEFPPEEYLNENYMFEILEADIDYVYDYDSGLLYIKRPNGVNNNYTIGITYINEAGLTVGNPDETNLKVKLLRRSNQEDTDFTWKFQARNIYDLHKEGIKNEGFDISIYTRDSSNNRIDTLPSEIDAGMKYIDYLRLDNNGDGLVNGDDSAINLSAGLVYLPLIEPFSVFSDSVIYHKENLTTSEDEQVLIDITIKGKIGRDQINLNQMNILPGSVKVKVNGDLLIENTDYIVDYDFGNITLLSPKAKDSDASISIDFEYKPLFGVEAKSMFGLRADWKPSENFRLGSTVIYHSEKTSQERPKIGEESIKLLLADIDGELKANPEFMTKMVNWLPLVQTDAESEIKLSGEIAVSVPTIEGSGPDKNQAYLDDMESALESYPLGTSWKGWSLGSKPYGTEFGKGKINWYNDDDRFEAKDIYDNLTEDEEEQKVNVLTCKITPNKLNNPGITGMNWTGLMKYIGNQLDFSEKQYIEILVKVDQDSTGHAPNVVMHVDLGDINEDFYTENGGLGKLNREDGIKYTLNGREYEGSLDGAFDAIEDVGLDGIPTGATGDDPFDDADDGKEGLDYPRLNGTEENGQLDTEDLDGNGSLNSLDRYLEFTIALNDPSYESISSGGWRLYRLPIEGKNVYNTITSGSTLPSLEKISYARVWFEYEKAARVNIVTLDVVGNKWEAKKVKKLNYTQEIISTFDDEEVAVGIIDNKKNEDHYTPPKGSYSVVDRDKIPTLEQSIFLSFSNIHRDNYFLARQRFKESYNLLNYDRIKLFAFLEEGQGDANPLDDKQDFVVRLGADSLNYYEVRGAIQKQPYRKMVQNDWREIVVDFSNLSYFTVNKDSLEVEGSTAYLTYEKDIEEANDTYHYIFTKKGNPTLSNIREVAVGLYISPEAAALGSGRIYYDDLRVEDPYDDIGWAARSTINTTFADFMDYSANISWRTPNFRTVTERSKTVNTSTGETRELSMQNNYKLQKFMPASWGMNIPVRLTYSNRKTIPRFKNNSDVLRKYLNEEDKKHEMSISNEKSVSVSVSQSTTPQNKWLAYTVKNISLEGSASFKDNRTPTAKDTTTTYKAKGSYNLNIPREKTALKLFGNYSFYYLPATFNNQVTWNTVDVNSYQWKVLTDTTYWEKYASNNNKKTIDTQNTVEWGILSDVNLSYSLNTSRDLTRRDDEDKVKRLWFMKIGMETHRDQTAKIEYNPNYIDDILSFSGSISATYREDQRKTKDNVNEPDVYKIEGSVTRPITFNFTLKNKDMLLSLAEWAFPGNKQGRADEKSEDFDFPEEDGKNPDKDFSPKEQINPQPTDSQEEKKGKFGEEKELSEKEFSEKDFSEKEGKATEKKEAEKEQKDNGKSSGGKFNFLAYGLNFIARLDNISGSYSYTEGSTFQQRDHTTPFLYQLGFTNSIKKAGERLQDAIKTKNEDSQLSLSSNFPIWRGLAARTDYSLNTTRTYSSASTKSVTTNFPDIKATWGRLQELIGMEEYMDDSRLSSSFSKSVKETGTIDWDKPDWDKPTSRVTSTNFSPLVGMQTRWIKNITTDISYNMRNDETISFRQNGNNVREATTQSLDGRLSWSFSAEKGVHLPSFWPFRGKRISFKNELSTTIDFSYEKKQGTTTSTQNGEVSKLKDQDLVKYTFAPGASYNFSRNIKGGLSSRYETTNDLKKDEKTSLFNLSIWVQIDF